MIALLFTSACALSHERDRLPDIAVLSDAGVPRDASALDASDASTEVDAGVCVIGDDRSLYLRMTVGAEARNCAAIFESEPPERGLQINRPEWSDVGTAAAPAVQLRMRPLSCEDDHLCECVVRIDGVSLDELSYAGSGSDTDPAPVAPRPADPVPPPQRTLRAQLSEQMLTLWEDDWSCASCEPGQLVLAVGIGPTHVNAFRRTQLFVRRADELCRSPMEAEDPDRWVTATYPLELREGELCEDCADERTLATALEGQVVAVPARGYFFRNVQSHRTYCEQPMGIECPLVAPDPIYVVGRLATF